MPQDLLPFIIAGVALFVLVTLGVITHSYRDVSNRHIHKPGAGHDSHSAGH
jgi:hypothetical protein